MRKLIESPFQSIDFEEEYSLLSQVWKPESANLTQELHVSEVHSIYMFMRKLQPERYLCDIRELKYELDEEQQAFIANLFSENTARLIAIVTSHQPSVSMNLTETLQHLEEEASTSFTLRYFAEAAEAMAWLMADFLPLKS